MSIYVYLLTILIEWICYLTRTAKDSRETDQNKSVQLLSLLL